MKNEIYKVKKWEEKIRRKDLLYKTNKYRYDFQQYETISSFGDSIYNGKISIDEGDIDQSSLLDGLKDFNDKARPKTAEGKNKKWNTYEGAFALYEGRELILNAFRMGAFSIKTQGKGLRILTSKQMLQRLPIALAQVKASSTSENLLNEIRQIIHYLYWTKEGTEKVYNNIMNWIEV